MSRPFTPIGIRLFTRLDQSDPSACWVWPGATNRPRTAAAGAYGIIGRGGRNGGVAYVHRVAYTARVGPIPEGYEIDHRCANTLCCNPAHLEAVPPRENNMRSTSWAALNAAKETCPNGHEYDERNTGHRRPSESKSSPNASRWRYCRACAREAQRARRAGLTYPEWRASLQPARPRSEPS